MGSLYDMFTIKQINLECSLDLQLAPKHPVPCLTVSQAYLLQFVILNHFKFHICIFTHEPVSVMVQINSYQIVVKMGLEVTLILRCSWIFQSSFHEQ